MISTKAKYTGKRVTLRTRRAKPNDQQPNAPPAPRSECCGCFLKRTKGSPAVEEITGWAALSAPQQHAMKTFAAPFAVAKKPASDVKKKPRAPKAAKAAKATPERAGDDDAAPPSPATAPAT